MERIMIIGCGGSGKSTLARQLGEKLGYPVIHLDKIWWTGDWENISEDAFDAQLEELLAKPAWIVDGNYNRTIGMRLARCDTVIYLDYNRFTCLWGVFKRVVTNYGRVRPDMGGNCRERFDMEFLRWVWNYNRKKRPGNYALLESASHAEAIILKNRRQLRRFLASL